jgi:hypothetical protein
MKRLTLIAIGALAVFASPSFAVIEKAQKTSPLAPLGGNKAAVEVIKGLAQQGSTEAMSMLGRDLLAKGNKREGLSWLTRAADCGDRAGMLELGLALVTVDGRSEGELKEGLVQLAMAEWLEEQTAHFTLRYLPDLVGVEEKRITDARVTGYSRLSKSKDYVDEGSLGQSDHPCLAVRELKGELPGGGSGNPRAILDRHLANLDKKTERPGLFSEDEELIFRTKRDLENALKRRHYERLEAEAEENKTATGERKAYLDRRAARAAGAEVRTGQITAEQQAELLGHIKRALDRVNQHRAPEAALKISDLDLDFLPRGMDLSKYDADAGGLLETVLRVH